MLVAETNVRWNLAPTLPLQDHRWPSASRATISRPPAPSEAISGSKYVCARAAVAIVCSAQVVTPVAWVKSNTSWFASTTVVARPPP